jgi:alkanesulfonate monooxygenase
MSGKRQMHLNAFMRPVSIHTGAWRYPGAWPDANFNLPKLVELIQHLERGCFDAFFMADHMAVLNMPYKSLRRSHTVTSFEPFTLLSALAMVTKHIGLAATASTTYDAPYHIARRFASLDHLSNGRAAWNIVTTSNPDAAKNFGMDTDMDHDERYARAREFYDVVTGLWDSWADDAVIRDVESGIFSDPDKVHVLDHKGKYLSVRGPLNIARAPQGWPVIVQAGASNAGRQVAAETAEMVFASQRTLEDGKEYYADIKARAEKIGRNPDHIKILPSLMVMLGETDEEAKEKRAILDSGVHEDSAIPSLSISLGHDASVYDLDKPLPDDIPETNAGQSSRASAIKLARREGLTVRQLAQRLGGHSGLAFNGTVKTVADNMEQWLDERGCDGFTMQFPYVPGGLVDFVDKLVPELQRRGIFRKKYEGTTLRENLGLPRPENRFFVGDAAKRDVAE